MYCFTPQLCVQVTGHRHAFMCRYKVGFNNDGSVVALDAVLYSNVGNSMVSLSTGVYVCVCILCCTAV
jgi:xanthine dehydrogenase molybdopterin-binding subunit B